MLGFCYELTIEIEIIFCEPRFIIEPDKIGGQNGQKIELVGVKVDDRGVGGDSLRSALVSHSGDSVIFRRQYYFTTVKARTLDEPSATVARKICKCGKIIHQIIGVDSVVLHLRYSIESLANKPIVYR